MTAMVDVAEALAQRISDLRQKLETQDLSAMEAYNVVRAIVHLEQELASLD